MAMNVLKKYMDIKALIKLTITVKLDFSYLII